VASHEPICDGQGDVNGDHCCWLDGAPCPHLVVNGPTGFRYACGLRTELGSWAAVHADPRYLADVRPVWLRTGTVDCGNWWGPAYERALELRDSTDATVEQIVEEVAQCCFLRRYRAGNTRLKRDVRVAIRSYLNSTER
jgi:hypothetical protein